MPFGSQLGLPSSSHHVPGSGGLSELQSSHHPDHSGVTMTGHECLSQYPANTVYQWINEQMEECLSTLVKLPFCQILKPPPQTAT